MPVHSFTFSEYESLNFQDEGIFLCTEGDAIMLRPVNEDGLYDIFGSLKTSYVELRPWNPLVWESFFGFEVDGNDNSGDIRFQFSPDGGQNYLWHNGSEWISADQVEESNSIDEIKCFIDIFPIWDVLRIKMFLVPIGNLSPVIRLVSLLVEYRTHEIVEDIYRSLIKFIKDADNFVMPYEEVGFPMSDTIVLDHDAIGMSGDIEQTLKVKTPIWVFNLDDDPKMRNNLFDSLMETSTIKLKKETSGHIKVIFTTEPEIHIQTDFDLVPIASHPSITLQVLTVSRGHIDGPGNYPCIEKNTCKLIAKAREGLRKYIVTFRVRSYASKVTDSLMFTGGIRRLIEQKDRILSLNYDKYMEALWGTQMDSDWVTENLYAQSYTPKFVWDDWSAQDKPVIVPLVDTEENGGGYRVLVHLGHEPSKI